MRLILLKCILCDVRTSKMCIYCIKYTIITNFTESRSQQYTCFGHLYFCVACSLTNKATQKKKKENNEYRHTEANKNVTNTTTLLKCKVKLKCKQIKIKSYENKQYINYTKIAMLCRVLI